MYHNHNKKTHTYFIPILALKLGAQNNKDKTLLKYHKPVRILRNRTVLKRKNYPILSYETRTKHNIKHVSQVKAKRFNSTEPSKLIKFFKKMTTKNKLQWIGFFVLALISLINISYMTLRFIDNKYEYNIFNHAHIEAILPGQQLPGTVSTGVVLLRELDLNKLKVGDQVVICCDFGQPDTYWVEQVVAIDRANNSIEVSYDLFFMTTVTPDQILGVFVETSGFIGTMYYTSTFVRGYLLLTSTHFILLYGYFYIVLKKRKDKIFGL